MANRMGMFFYFHQITGGFQVRHQLFPAFIAVQSCIGFARFRQHRAAIADHPDRRQTVALPHLKVVGIMGRRHFDRAGAERRIDILIGDNRQFPSDNRQDELAADHVCIAFIRRIDSHCGIAEDRLRSGSRDCYKFIRVVLQRIAHVVQLAGRLLMLHLDVRQSCVAARTPVGDAFALINQSFFIQ